MLLGPGEGQILCTVYFKVVDVKAYQMVKNDYLLLPQFFCFFSSSGTHQSHHLDGCQAIRINPSFIFAF